MADFIADSARTPVEESCAPASAELIAPGIGGPCPPESADDGSVTVCARGHVNTVGDSQCSVCGVTLKGNRLAVANALRAVRLPPELAHLRDEIATYEAACLVDEGDAADIPTRRRSLLHIRARVQRRIVQLDDSLELRGLIDRRGRLRVAWLQRFEGLIATAVRLDTVLGLERKAKTVPSLAEYLKQRASLAGSGTIESATGASGTTSAAGGNEL